ncbi:retron St85 family RNA-directed DNA polymerase [Burkholderia cenocepacia]|uniref:retron St85 family RNA-directed DNA polymerase n=1 Tax=Burkholderia cenocepacia TaxID=95486 RepID=UPI0009B21FF3|nr:retron St85 family RNA-directed DNA polymerase [Burkholderia cenocepacia]MCW3688789.1 retron St85 family RNA-directed DNA polymerase [Burkholderia cenocepacia]
MNIVERMANELLVPQSLLENALRLAYVRFRRIKVPKRSGGERVMIQPASELKLVLSWLDSRVLSNAPVSSIATAFEPGTSIVKNARVHSKSLYSVRIDLSNFFPSIRSRDLLLALSRSRELLPEWASGRDFEAVMRNACFDRADRLPVGYMTSPRIANIVMLELDTALVAAVSRDSVRFGRGVLTRYADDFVFSTDKKGACNEFLSEMRSLMASMPSPKLSINDEKTRFMSRKGGTTLITGLRVNNDGDVGIHANYRDHIRMLLKLFSTGRLKPAENEKLRGHLAFIEHADPDLFTRLSFRYHSEIATLRGHPSLNPV